MVALEIYPSSTRGDGLALRRQDDMKGILVETYEDAMIPTTALIIIKEFEGLSLVPYRCPAGVLTIGYGVTRLGNFPVTVNDQLLGEDEASELLRVQLEKEYLPKLELIPGWFKMNENQQSALISFAWNLGANFYGSNGFETITKYLRRKDWVKVPGAIKLYTYAGKQKLTGLVRRRNAEAELWNRPVEEGCLGLEEI